FDQDAEEEGDKDFNAIYEEGYQDGVNDLILDMKVVEVGNQMPIMKKVRKQEQVNVHEIEKVFMRMLMIEMNKLNLITIIIMFVQEMKEIQIFINQVIVL
ncbi:MAG: hypothetical protein EZS28_024580, partial [Streblomastix strix]